MQSVTVSYRVNGWPSHCVRPNPRASKRTQRYRGTSATTWEIEHRLVHQESMHEHDSRPRAARVLEINSLVVQLCSWHSSAPLCSYIRTPFTIHLTRRTEPCQALLPKMGTRFSNRSLAHICALKTLSDEAGVSRRAVEVVDVGRDGIATKHRAQLVLLVLLVRRQRGPRPDPPMCAERQSRCALPCQARPSSPPSQRQEPVQDGQN